MIEVIAKIKNRKMTNIRTAMVTPDQITDKAMHRLLHDVLGNNIVRDDD